jgi:hypothetical protein
MRLLKLLRLWPPFVRKLTPGPYRVAATAMFAAGAAKGGTFSTGAARGEASA